MRKRATAVVLVLAALMLPAGCASPRPMRPPVGSLFSNSRYRTPTPSFLDETSARDEAWHAGEARERERAPSGATTSGVSTSVKFPEIEERIRRRIRANTTPRHVPARIVQVADIPRTKSGKIVELAVRDVVHGREVKNREALANPEALDQYRNHPELI